MSTFPQIPPEQWEKLQAFVEKAVNAARYMSAKLTVLLWIAVLSAAVLGWVIYKTAGLQLWVLALVVLILLLPALAVNQVRRRLQDVANAPQALNDLRDAIMSIPATLREAGLGMQDGKLKFDNPGNIFAMLKQLRTVKQAAGDIKSRVQEVGSPGFVMSVLAVSSPAFIGLGLFAVVATFLLAMIAALSAVGWLIAQ